MSMLSPQQTQPSASPHTTPLPQQAQLSSPPFTGDTLVGMAVILAAEYEALRREIDVYHEHQKEFMNFNIVVSIGMFSLLGILFSLDPERAAKISFTFLLFPMVFMLLALFYTDRTIRVLRIADYLHNHLRPKANVFTGQKVLQWELYKRNTRLFPRGLPLFLDRSRWFAFIFPSVLALIIFLVVHDGPWVGLEIVLVAMDSVAIFISFLVMFVAEESSGIMSARQINLDDAL